MKLSQVLVTVIFFCALQELNGRPQGNPNEPSPVQEAIQKINPELDKISHRLKNLKFDLQKLLLQSLVDEHGSIAQSGKVLLEAIKNLESNATQNAAIANKSNINIDECREAQRVKLDRVLTIASGKTVEVSEESRDRSSNFSQQANELMKKAEDIDKNLNKIIGYCIRQNGLPWQQEKIIECMFREADYLNHKVVDDLYQEKTQMENNRNHVIPTNPNNPLERISSIQAEFLECVSEADQSTRPSQKPSGVINKTDEITSSNLLNEDPKLNTTQNFQDPQKIRERIQKLQFLLEQLKQVRRQNSEEGSFLKRNPFQSNCPYRPNHVNNWKNKTQQADQENRPYILYISL